MHVCMICNENFCLFYCGSWYKKKRLKNIVLVSFYFIFQTIPNFHSFLQSLAFPLLSSSRPFLPFYLSFLPPSFPPPCSLFFHPSFHSLPLYFPFFTHSSQNQLFGRLQDASTTVLGATNTLIK